jgi:hypothetical protein
MCVVISYIKAHYLTMSSQPNPPHTHTNILSMLLPQIITSFHIFDWNVNVLKLSYVIHAPGISYPLNNIKLREWVMKPHVMTCHVSLPQLAVLSSSPNHFVNVNRRCSPTVTCKFLHPYQIKYKITALMYIIYTYKLFWKFLVGRNRNDVATLMTQKDCKTP